MYQNEISHFNTWINFPYATLVGYALIPLTKLWSCQLETCTRSKLLLQMAFLAYVSYASDI